MTAAADEQLGLEVLREHGLAALLAAEGPLPAAGLPTPAGRAECTLLNDAFDVEMQFVLFAVALCTLVAKWRCEADRRSAMVFLLDASKQGAGFLVCHTFNLYFSWVFRAPHASACVWYAVNIVLDCTARVYVAYLLLQWAKSHHPQSEATHFGVYGDPPCLRRWAGQTGLWAAIVSISRVLMAFAVWSLEKPLGHLGGYIMSPLEGYSATHGHYVELVVVMVVVPFVLNVVQLHIQDSFLKYQHGVMHFYHFAKRAMTAPEPHTTMTTDWDTVDDLFGSAMSKPTAATPGGPLQDDVRLEGELQNLFRDDPGMPTGRDMAHSSIGPDSDPGCVRNVRTLY